MLTVAVGNPTIVIITSVAQASIGHQSVAEPIKQKCSTPHIGNRRKTNILLKTRNSKWFTPRKN
jgi:hypothetical protein